jgi:general secretion pathway protein C
MVTTTKGGPLFHFFNFRYVLNHRVTVFSITALLAIYVAWQAGSLVWKVWLLDSESTQAATVIPMSSGKAEPESLQNVLRYPLIRSESMSASGGAAAIDQPITSLNLKLVGLMYSPDKDQARAIIENPEDGASSYSIHERVADNAEIYSIEPDRVILLHAGRQEALMLDPEQESATAPGTTDQPANERPAGQASANPGTAPGQSSASSPRKLDDVMRDFSATPVMEDGNLVGFRLAALRDPKILNDWGIDSSDVITAVNGMPLNSQGRVMFLYNKLKKEGEIELTLDNGGNSRTLTVEVD